MAHENVLTVVDPSRYPDAAECRNIRNSIDVFYLYGRGAILSIFVFDKEIGGYLPVPKPKLKDWVHSLAQDQTFGRFEVFAHVDGFRASLSKNEAAAAHARFKERLDRNARQRSGFHDDEDEEKIPGPMKTWLDS